MVFKSLIKYFRHSSNLFSLLGNLLFTAFSLATFLIMVRVLDKEIYGSWVIYITMASLLDMLRLGLTGTAAIRMISISKGEDQKNVVASSYHLSILTTLLIIILFPIAYFSLKNLYPENYYVPVLLYYPFLAAANLSFNQAITLQQGFLDFKKIFTIRAINGTVSFIGISTYLLGGSSDLHDIIVIHILASFITSIFTIVKRWDGLQFISNFHKPTLKHILNFGKYSTASYVGSNLLRSSDTIILSLSSVMGASAVAIYSIPLKFVELAEIPLRSFTATAFPKFSNAFKTGKENFNNMLSLYFVATTLILVPAVVILVSFPGFFLFIISGNAYADTLELQKSLVYIIAFYILLLPVDRYSGVALFALDRPDINFLKIMVMLFLNIVFDIIAVFVFQSLIMVISATVIFTLIGLFMGWFFIRRETSYSVKTIPVGIKEIVRIIFVGINKLKHGIRAPK
jgi:O-antigen/teichoic acid export membrane protein